MEDTGTPATWRIGLASARNAPSIEERLAIVDRFLAEAAEQDVAIACFPETYLPGLRGMDFPVPTHDQARQGEALEAVRAGARRHGVAVVIGMEWETALGVHNVAFVIDRDGEVLGYQAKNQIPPEEEPYYVPDGQRRLFAIDGVPFGITICHEGWRYPEAVRWSATRGAKVVFHPHLTGSDISGVTPERWGDPASPYYEKTMVARSAENTIYFASVNCAMRYQDSATTLIGPDGACLAYVPYGEERLLVHDLDLSLATGFCAHRYNAAFYPASDPSEGP
ncbi:MAG TPA: carbon-nitrogen hydrolase family protein [Thermomicrobiales bacterium]|nr:carbon-nitrogen hydrolase family protein [Thermomicrobiales bacterium]